MKKNKAGKIIKCFLAESGMSRAILARKLGVSLSLVNHMISGRRAVNESRMRRLYEVTGVPVMTWLKAGR